MRKYYIGFWIFGAALLSVASVNSSNLVLPGPAEQIRPVVERAKAILENPLLKEKAKRKMLRELVMPEIDARGMAQSVLARRWQEYRSRQDEFVEAFADFFERKFSEKIEMFRGADVFYEKERIIDGEYAEVHLRIIVTLERSETTSKNEYLINLKLKLINGKWKIYDVSALGRSAIGAYRDEVNKFLLRHTFDELLESLRRGEIKAAPRFDNSR